MAKKIDLENKFTGASFHMDERGEVRRQPATVETRAISLVSSVEALRQFVPSSKGFSIGDIGLGSCVPGVRLDHTGFVQPSVTKEPYMPAKFVLSGPCCLEVFMRLISKMYPDIPLGRLRISSGDRTKDSEAQVLLVGYCEL